MPKPATNSKKDLFLNDFQKRSHLATTYRIFSEKSVAQRMAMLIGNPYFLYWYIQQRFFQGKGAVLFYGKHITIFSDDKKDHDATELQKFGILPARSEQKITKFFIKNLKKDDVFYDIGANYGFYSHLALEFCDEIHIFEPLSNAFESMRHDFAKNKNVQVNNVALSNESGTASLYTKNNHSGGSSLVDITEELSAEIKVAVMTLDEYISSHQPPTVVKIDVEGAEELVLQGSSKLLSTLQPTIVMEIWAKNVGEEAFSRTLRAIALLKEAGYTCYEINQEGEPLLYTGDFVEPTSSGDAWGDNFLFSKRSLL